MNCIWVEKISLLIDGELPANEELALQRHIAGCEECQLARADFLSFRTQISSVPVLQPTTSAQALASILSNDRRQQAVRAQRAPSTGLFAGLRFTPAFATAALLIVAGIIGISLYLNSKRALNNSGTESALATNSNTNRNSNRTPTPARSNHERESAAPSSSPGDASKPAGKSQKPKARPILPKLPTVPDDRVSPWANQAIASSRTATTTPVDTQTLTAHHLEQSELLLRSFRNVRTGDNPAEISYEKQRAQRLVYQNILVRREADAAGDVQVSTLLDSLEPILLDIANLPDQPNTDQVTAIKERLRRKNIVALLQVNSTSLARAND